MVFYTNILLKLKLFIVCFKRRDRLLFEENHCIYFDKVAANSKILKGILLICSRGYDECD